MKTKKNRILLKVLFVLMLCLPFFSLFQSKLEARNSSSDLLLAPNLSEVGLIVIDREACQGCGLCEDADALELIKMYDGKAAFYNDGFYYTALSADAIYYYYYTTYIIPLCPYEAIWSYRF